MSDSIRFDCLNCGTRYIVPKTSIGRSYVCRCGRETIIPQTSTVGMARVTWWDFFIGRLVYAGGGALIGFLIAFGLMARIGPLKAGYLGLLLWPLGGFLLGLLIGEPFINWLGRTFRRADY
jgi:hypothetical protein